LLEFAGEHFRDGAVFFASGGSEAIETALKLARQYQVEIGETKRHQIFSRAQSYHGATLGAVAVSGNRKRREIYLPMVQEWAHIGVPYCYRCAFDCTDSCYNCGQQYAAELERAIENSNGEAAAFIFEPMSGATLGAVVPPPGYLKSIAAICKRHGVLLIADEVMTGVGRTGSNFAVDQWDIAPDILVTAKGLSSGYAPLGAVIANRKVVDAIANGSGTLLHGYTYNAHPVSVAAGRAVMQRIRSQKLVAAANSDTGTVGTRLKAELQSLADLPSVGDVRGLGLLWGVEFVRDKKTIEPFAAQKNIAGMVGQGCQRRGVLVYPMQGCADGISRDHIVIASPAVITPEQIEWATAQVRAAIEEAT
jgi:adenosylmethionine-8-amino-7-oxononanoate aminotransferase